MYLFGGFFMEKREKTREKISGFFVGRKSFLNK